MKLIKHDTAEQILAAYWHFDENQITLEDFLKSECGGTTPEGEKVTFTGADELAGIKENGFWGFCDPQTKEVNVWIGEGAAAEEIIFFLGHEIGHASGSPVSETGAIEDEAAEEERADEYGAAARQAFLWLKELMPHVFAVQNRPENVK